MERRHFITFDLAGFSYYDGPLVFNELQIGSVLTLERDADNKYDAKAVVLSFNGYKLGYIPRGLNREISKILEMGHCIFEARIQRLDAASHPENQVGVIVYVVKKKMEID